MSVLKSRATARNFVTWTGASGSKNSVLSVSRYNLAVIFGLVILC